MRYRVISADCQYLDRELSHVPAAVRHRLVCANAAELYGFPLAADGTS